jgi:H+-transporting ATPase
MADHVNTPSPFILNLEADQIAAQSLDELGSSLESSTEGLAGSEAAQRLSALGPNALEEHETPAILKFLSYFWGPIPWMIEVALILSLCVGDWPDVTIIAILLLVNAFIGFWEEFKAGSAIKALKAKLALQCRAKRDGQWTQVPATDLVPGDVVHVKFGDVVPADAKLITGTNVAADQSSLTGESLPVPKNEGDVLFSGSVMQKGEGEALVYATGTHSFFGRTAQLVTQTKTVSHYQKAVMKIGNMLIFSSLALIVLILILSLYHHQPLLKTLEFVLILAVAAIPVALPAVLSVTMVVGAMVLSKSKAIVTRLVSIEEMAGMDMLCSDKTGTLTQNKLSLGETVLFAAAEEADVLQAAALASKAEDAEPIETPIFDKLAETGNALDGFTVEEFLPFDPVAKRTEATLRDQGGRTFSASKGAPQSIVALCDDDALAAQVASKVNDFAGRGYRTLGVARTDEAGAWQFLGLLSFFDPPREDSADTISQAKAMGVETKMVTGDHLAIGKETARQLGMGEAMYAASDVFAANSQFTDEQIDRSAGFAQVYPEHKYKIVEALQRRGHLVGMTGDGVNDAPALKKADAGIAVSGATDAARGAADLVLTLPGLSVIVTAIKESRKIFQRMTSYATYRIAETIDVLVFMTLSILIFQSYPLSAVMLIILALLNDLPIMMIAYDNVSLPEKPVNWDMQQIMSTAAMLGAISVGFSFLLYWFATEWAAIGHMLNSGQEIPSNILGSPLVEWLGLERIQHWQKVLPALVPHSDPKSNPISTLIFLKLAIAGHMTLYMARKGGRAFFRRPWPNWKLLAVCEGTQLAGLLVGVYGLGVMAPVGWAWGVFLLAFAVAELLITDTLKVVFTGLLRTGGTAKHERRLNRLHQSLHHHAR